MTRRVLFLAPSRQQASYWANQLGFRDGEWQFLSHSFLHGHRGPTVYLCGQWQDDPSILDALDALAPCEPTVILAEKMVP